MRNRGPVPMSWRTLRAFSVILLASATCRMDVGAQTAQSLSLQLSPLLVYPFGGGLEVVTGGFGWEVQARWNPGAFSIGAGVEQTFHEVMGAPGRDIVLTGGFLEPRYVVDIGSNRGNRAALYFSARAAVSHLEMQLAALERAATGYTLNGGGGLLFRLGDRLNLDLGATVGFKDLGLVNLPTLGPVELGSGSNLVGRVGLAIGIG